MAIQLRERPGASAATNGGFAIPFFGKVGILAFAVLVTAGGLAKYMLSKPHKPTVATASSLTTSGGKLRARSETRSIVGDPASMQAAERARAVRSIPMGRPVDRSMDRSSVAVIDASPETQSAPLNFGFAGLQRASGGAYQGFRDVTRPPASQP